MISMIESSAVVVQYNYLELPVKIVWFCDVKFWSVAH